MARKLTYQELKERFDDVGGDSEGIIRVSKNGRTFHIRPDGTPISEDRHEEVTDSRPRPEELGL